HERRVGPSDIFSRGGDFHFTERRAVGLLRAFEIGRTLAYRCAASDEGWPVGSPGALYGGGDRVRVVTVDTLNRPAGGGEPRRLVHRCRERRGTIDGDPVIVPEH